MVLGPHIANKSGLKTYIKERLGEPVINVEVSDEQIEHIINETLEKWVEFAEGGTQLRVKTQAIVAGTQSYTMSYDTYAIINLFDSADFNLGSTIFDDVNLSPAVDFNPLFNEVMSTDLLTIELSRQMLESINFMLKVQVLFDYNSTTRELYLIDSPDKTYTGGVVYYQITDYSDESSKIYDHQWIKRYATALTRHQWGSNLTKYSGSPLPAGLQLNAESILSKAETDIEKLDEELELVWRLPTDFAIG